MLPRRLGGLQNVTWCVGTCEDTIPVMDSEAERVRTGAFAEKNMLRHHHDGVSALQPHDFPKKVPKAYHPSRSRAAGTAAWQGTLTLFGVLGLGHSEAAGLHHIEIVRLVAWHDVQSSMAHPSAV